MGSRALASGLPFINGASDPGGFGVSFWCVSTPVGRTQLRRVMPLRYRRLTIIGILGSKQPLLKLWQSSGRGGEQPLEAGPHVLLLPAAPGAVGKCGCAGECGSCGSGGVGRVGGMTVLCFYLSPG